MPGAMADLRALPNKLNHKQASCRIIIETPRYCRSKFNYDPETNLFELSMLLPEGMVFPFDFGFIPSTLGDDGDPLDIIVMLDEPAHVGCLVDIRLVGVIEAEQTEDGKTETNHRLLGVARHSYSHQNVRTLEEIPPSLLDQIEHWFISYNHLHEKEFKVTARSGPERAVSLIQDGMKLWESDGNRK
jgi:inorganic pyrophosphatase